VCRNLWNFSALNYYDKNLFTKFGEIVTKNADQLAETDVANVIRAFSEFDHVQYEPIESVMKATIKNVENWKL
jgi:hypothetical protein